LFKVPFVDIFVVESLSFEARDEEIL
jgi:hypothetical protein